MGASSFVNVPNSTRRHGPPVFLRLSRQGPSGSVRVRVLRRVRSVCGILAVAHVARRSHGGGALDRCHSRRLPVSVALVGLALLAVLALAAAAVPASARTGGLQGVRAKAKALATNVAALDAQIDAAVQRCTRATDSLVAVRREISGNKRLQTLALRELDVARATLVARAVAIYKHDDVTALDAMFSADDFGDLVSRLTMVQSIARGDRVVLRTVERTKRELADRAVSLVADERTARKLVVQRDAELKSIKAQLGDRRHRPIGELALGALDGAQDVAIAARDALHHRKPADEIAEVVGAEHGVERRDVVVLVERDGTRDERGARHVQFAERERLQALVAADLTAHRNE